MTTETITPELWTKVRRNIGQGDYTKDKYKENDLTREESIRQIKKIHKKKGLPLLNLN